MAGSLARRLARTGHVLVGMVALIVIGYWIGVTAPTAGARSPSGAPSPTTDQPVVDGDRMVESSLGCADGLAAVDLDAFFAGRIGPLVGWDNPHVIELGPNRWLWLIQDSYLDHEGDARTLWDTGLQLQNVALVQTGPCFTLLHRGTPEERLNFEIGDGHVDFSRFLWPLGGEVDGDVVRVFWAEMVPSVPEPPVGQGIIRHPVSTWLAEYDLTTLERRSFAPAPNSGVDPTWGFAVASDDDHSYLFGNSNQFNLMREGGLANGPHSATLMHLARVPRGRLDLVPEYWDGTGWAADSGASAPISDRFWTENTMQPRFLDGRWISVVKRDGFYGSEVWLEVAHDPWGPWIAVDAREYRPRAAAVEKNSYQPIVLPWSSIESGVEIVISENAADWSEAKADPDLYRPAVYEIAWPAEPDAALAAAAERLGDLTLVP